MGLLDLLTTPDSGNGVGGLLSYLNSPLYKSPLQTPEAAPQPQYDPMGNYTGITTDVPNPFGPIPQANLPAPGQYAPPSVFSGSAPALMGLPGSMQAPSTPAPSLPPPQTIAPAPQSVSAPVSAPAQMQARAPATDISAQSHQAEEPQIGFGDRLMAGFQNFANAGGPLQAIAGGLGGLVSGQRTDPQGMQQQALSASFKALVDAGVPRNTAMAAAMNPKLLEQIAPQYFGKNELVDGGTDPFTGQKRFFWKNGADETLRPATPEGGRQGSASAQGLEAFQAAANSGVKGEALLNYLPKEMTETVRAMIDGRRPAPTGMGMKNPAVLAAIEAAHTVDPTFDETTWAARNAGRKDFEGGGKSSEMVRAANQTLAHVGSLMDAMDKLNNGSIPALNAIGNTFNEQVRGKGEPGSFRTNAHAVAEEMSKVFKGANLSDAEIRQWEQNLSENMSPAQQKAQVAKLSELLHGSLQALEEKRVQSLGPLAAEKSGPLIKPEGQKVLARIDEWLNQNGGATQSVPSLKVGESKTIGNITIKKVRD